MLEELERRAREGPPRYRLLLRKELPLEQQVQHVGPTWLDRVAPGSFVGFGFGGEVRTLLAARREAMRRMGVGPDDVGQERKLRELERRAVAAQIAMRTGQVLVARIGNDFRGRVAIADANAPGSDYVVVSDGARFALLRATPSLRAAVGAMVTISRDGQRTHDGSCGSWQGRRIVTAGWSFEDRPVQVPRVAEPQRLLWRPTRARRRCLRISLVWTGGADSGARVLVPIPNRDFDPSDVAIPWKVLAAAG